tara:strand:- start:1591 stop:2703 length:1113 start_codon:yes stop_codon:yes gene_type:complete
MKIKTIDTIMLRDNLLVKITTDKDIEGIGEATFWSQPKATIAVIDQFKDSLIGKNTKEIDSIWSSFYRSSSFRGAAIGSALSAIDVALWDILGKFHNSPVYELLGGKHRNKIRMCALCMGKDTNETLKMVSSAIKLGYTAIKIDPFPEGFGNWKIEKLTNEVVSQVAAVRKAIGQNIDLCVEVHRKLTPRTAVPLMNKLEEFNLLFIEDPIQPDSIDSMAEVSNKTSLPIATGERLHTIYEFKEILSRNSAVDLKLDVGLQGGFSQCKKIAGMAEAFHATISPHNGKGPVLTASHIQLAASIPNFLILEYREDPTINLFNHSLNIKNGYIEVPNTPGIGINLQDNRQHNQFNPIKTNLAPKNEDGSIILQ